MITQNEIAIVGVGCRFPGADDVEEFWRVLSKKENHVVQVPADRWNANAFRIPEKNSSGKSHPIKAGFLKSVDEWDHKLYGLSDKEAEFVDPQHRLVLDCVHMAFEDGGLTRKDLEGSTTGVYIGSMTDDYKGELMDDTEVNSTYSVTGTHRSVISARVSYTYNLIGPAVTIDTACSSSLVAIDIASKAILSGDCDMAICGGVNVLLDPNQFTALSNAGMLSVTGQCKTFTADADGYARGEGCGIVILKPLRKAKSEGNKIWGTILTGTNQDGRMTSPITAPSMDQQQKLIEQIYTRHGIDKSKVQVIEAHGTGTPVGDPTEIQALSVHFGKQAGAVYDVFVGSVKTNIGHLEAAAGVAGLIKVLLMMKHETIVPSLFYSKCNENPRLRLAESGFVVPTELNKWVTQRNQRRLACVNSFGFGGTNAHAIVTEYKYPLQSHSQNTSWPADLPYVIALSAMDSFGLNENVKSLYEALQSNKFDLPSLSCTSTCKRDHRPQRTAVLGKSQDQLLASCKKVLDEQKISDSIPDFKPNRLIFVFCGVGTTWNGMCKRLLENSVFAKTILDVDSYLEPLASWSIRKKLCEETNIKSDPLVSHIALFACQIALAALWEHLGVKPDVVVGQSVGEVAAAYVSGYIDLPTAVRIIYIRSKYLATVKEGGMTVVRGVPTTVVEDICRLENSVCVAVYSSRTSCTISGSIDGVRNVKERLQNKEDMSPFFDDLDVSCAYHSHLVAEVSDKIGRNLRDIKVQDGRVPFISTVTGSESNIDTANYWKDNVRKPVQLSKAIELSVRDKEHNIFLEIGPSPVLRAHMHSILETPVRYLVVPSMKKEREFDTFMETASSLYANGLDLHWSAICPCQNFINNIPKYQFRKRRELYRSPRVVLRNQGVDSCASSHMFIKQIPTQAGNTCFKAEINHTTTPFVFDHIVKKFVVIPGALFAEVGFEVAKSVMSLSEKDACVSLEFKRPVKPEREKNNILLISTVTQSSEILFHVKHNQATVCKGWVRKSQDSIQKKKIDIELLKLSICMTVKPYRNMDTDDMYKTLKDMGFEYGCSFRLMRQSITNGTESLTLLDVHDTVINSGKRTTLHPCILDAMIQSAINSTTPELLAMIKSENLNFLPVAIGELSVLHPLEKKMYVFAKRINTTVLDTVFQVHFNVLLLDMEGIVLANLRNYMTYGKRKGCQAPCELSYNMTWHALHAEPNSSSTDCKILTLVNTEDKEVKRELENMSNFELYLKEKAKDRDTFVEQAFSSYSNRLCARQNPDAVLLLIPNLNVDQISSEETALEIHASVRENCLLLAHILKYMTDNSIKAPVYIGTQNTQPSCLMKEVDVNLVGHELWGFARSVHMEFIYEEMTLIDLQPSLKESKQTLLQFIQSNFQDLKPTKPEVVIRKNEIFGAQFTKTPKNGVIPKLRVQQMFPKRYVKNLRLFSTKSTDVCSVFYVEIPITEANEHTTQSQTVIETVSVHPMFVYPITTSGLCGDQDIWQEPLHTDHALYGLEYTGVVHSQDDTENKDHVVAIFPSKISTDMKIPEECTVNLKELPFYQPGLLLFALISWKLVDYIPTEASVAILCRTTASMKSNLLLQMLKDRKGATVFPYDDLDQITSKGKIDVLLVIEKNFTVFPHIGNFKQIIGLSECIEEGTRTIALRRGSPKIISPSAIDLLEKTSVSSNLSDVVAWLQQKFKNDSLDRINPEVQAHNDKDSWLIPCQTVNISGKDALEHPICHSLENVFKRSGVYIVTGGLTGLGWELVQVIAEMGAGTVVSISRRKVSGQKRTEINYMEKRTGCNVMALQGDVNELKSLQSIVGIIKRQTNGCSIRGVFHGAAVLQGALLMNLNEQDLDYVLKPKVIGTLNLHIATADLDLDFFVVLSSISSIIGNPGQSSYGAANAFMETFIQWRRRRGMAGQSINWGALEVGMASRQEFIENFKKRGFNLLKVLEIRTCFQEALMCNSTGVIYSDISWEQCAKNYANPLQQRYRLQMNVLFDEMIFSYSAFDSDVTDNTAYDINAVRSEDRDTQLQAVTRLVQKVAGKVFGGESEIISMSSTLADLALDSMSTVTFINVVHDITGHRIAPAFMQNTSHTLQDVGNFLLDTMFRQ